MIGNNVLACALRTKRGTDVVLANHGDAEAVIRFPKQWQRGQSIIEPAASAVLQALPVDEDEAVRQIAEVNPGAKPF